MLATALATLGAEAIAAALGAGAIAAALGAETLAWVEAAAAESVVRALLAGGVTQLAKRSAPQIQPAYDLHFQFMLRLRYATHARLSMGGSIPRANLGAQFYVRVTLELCNFGYL